MKRANLDKILSGLRWAVVGGVATRAYMPERATVDLDILVEPSQYDRVQQKLREAGCSFVQHLTVGGSTWKLSDGTLVDVLAIEANWVSEALADLKRDPQGLPVVSLTYLVLMKLQSGRTQDLADIARMLGLASDSDCELTRSVVRKYQPDAVEDLQSLISLGKLEAGRT